MLRGLGLSCFLVLFVSSAAFARTREEVLAEAGAYAAVSWEPSGNNILDSYNLIRDSYVPPENLQRSSDGVDDRFYKWNDKLVPPRWVYSKSNWPFEVCSTCTYHGEAYAWGIDHTTDSFKEKLKTNSLLKNPCFVL